MLNQGNHRFHMVDSSPMPIMTGAVTLFLVSSVIIMFHYFNVIFMMLSLTILLILAFEWWSNVMWEATNQGIHSNSVLLNMKWGMVLFILSEVMFFFSFFWCFFHSSLSSVVELGSLWPPKNIYSFNAFQIPLLNTIVLISSGATVTWSHYSLVKGEVSSAKISLILTIVLGLYFSFLQGYEYKEAMYSISDSVFGAIFFVATGFHGLHVLIGSSLLLVMSFRMMLSHFCSNHHFGLEAAAWYWHFVDVVWLFLFSAVYWWGG